MIIEDRARPTTHLNLDTIWNIETIFSKNFQKLPWWSSALESALQCRRYQFNPWSRKIPHAAGQLIPCTTTTEPVCYNFWSPCALEPLCVCVCVCVCVRVSSLTLCDPRDCSPPGSSVHGISQARVLEWVAISWSRGFSQLKDQTLHW